MPGTEEELVTAFSSLRKNWNWMGGMHILQLGGGVAPTATRIMDTTVTIAIIMTATK